MFFKFKIAIACPPKGQGVGAERAAGPLQPIAQQIFFSREGLCSPFTLSVLFILLKD